MLLRMTVPHYGFPATIKEPLNMTPHPITPPQIRIATADDVDDIHAMLFEIARTTGCEDKFKSTPADLARDGFGPNPAFEALIAHNDDTAVALCLYFPSYSTFRGKAGIYIQDLFVAPEYRGGGFARHLIAQVASHARSQGRHYIRLSVDADNIIGQRFYARIGMHHAEDEKIHVLDGDAFNTLIDA
tara:strand:+ start:27516 stop:28076 length:561 start_codon:yes stop_codon:yes gene_type:complete